MPSRKPLIWMTTALAAAVPLAATLLFGVSLTPSLEKLPLHLEIRLDTIQPGSFKVVEWRDRQIVIYRPSAESLADLRALNATSAAPKVPDDENPVAFIYSQVSTNRGCVVVHRAKKDPSLAMDWRGGWVDPCHFGEWDYAGRFLRRYENGPVLSNLEVPRYRFPTRNSLVLL
jgi:ubiquinol-cytochrome c reductase iron-sulfur subunit